MIFFNVKLFYFTVVIDLDAEIPESSNHLKTMCIRIIIINADRIMPVNFDCYRDRDKYQLQEPRYSTVYITRYFILH